MYVFVPINNTTIVQNKLNITKWQDMLLIKRPLIVGV